MWLCITVHVSPHNYSFELLLIIIKQLNNHFWLPTLLNGDYGFWVSPNFWSDAFCFAAYAHFCAWLLIKYHENDSVYYQQYHGTEISLK